MGYLIGKRFAVGDRVRTSQFLGSDAGREGFVVEVWGGLTVGQTALVQFTEAVAEPAPFPSSDLDLVGYGRIVLVEDLHAAALRAGYTKREALDPHQGYNYGWALFHGEVMVADSWSFLLERPNERLCAIGREQLVREGRLTPCGQRLIGQARR